MNSECPRFLSVLIQNWQKLGTKIEDERIMKMPLHAGKLVAIGLVSVITTAFLLQFNCFICSPSITKNSFECLTVGMKRNEVGKDIGDIQGSLSPSSNKQF